MEYMRSSLEPNQRGSSRPIAELVSFTHPGGENNLRTLAIARNKYLDLLDHDPRFAGVEYLIAVDTDMCFPWEVDQIVKVSV